MLVTSSFPQRSPTSSGLLRFLATPSHMVAGWGLGMGLLGEGPARPLAVADNGAVFGVTSLVGGIVAKIPLPSRSLVEKP